MKSLAITLISTLVLGGWLAAGQASAGGAVPSPDVRAIVDSIHWLGQSSFRLSGGAVAGLTIYFDPVGKQVKSEPKADIVLISHSHGDHFSAADIKKIVKDGTVTVGPKDCKTGAAFRAVSPGDKLAIGKVVIEAVPAYNTNKTFHKRASNWCGYVVTVNGVRIYFAGDTDRIPEMKDLKVDIALLPIGGTYTMTLPEAAEAALDINATFTIPMHYGTVVGAATDGEAFKSLLKGKLEVVVKVVE